MTFLSAPAISPGAASAAHAARDRHRRSLAAAIAALAGCIDVLSAAGPPLHRRLHLVNLVVPFAVSQTATALVALAGVALLLLARAIHRGQRQAWAVASGLLAVTSVLHLVKGVDVVSALVSLAVLSVLVIIRDSFQTAVDGPSRRRGLVGLVLGGFVATVLSTLVVELFTRVDHDGPNPPVGRTALAVGQRLVGLRSLSLPGKMGVALDPSLLAIGVVLLLLTSRLIARPVVDRRRSAPAPSRTKARNLVDRYGSGTLDYFALRHDKQHFFHGETLVTYAVYGGVCLVSPDPIGPEHERSEAWASFRHFADLHGWTVAALGTGEEWLRSYRQAGMRHLYVGDEAIVDVAGFSLDGGRRKSLRQAVNRIAKYGYTMSFHDPAVLEPALAKALERIMERGRRGSCERGFSMTLGRLFDPEDEGLLLAVARGPDGEPVAFCQFVPAPGIDGYSLDLMRRDGAEHPNGLVDFVVVSTIEHLRSRQMTGLALNFAAMRSVIAGEGGSLAARGGRIVLRRLSRSMQIESLWRYTAKYDPTWLPRHVVFERPGDLFSIALAIARAESFLELPVLGRALSLYHHPDGDGGAGEGRRRPRASRRRVLRSAS